PSPAAQKLYDEAQKLSRGLEETANDYTPRARDQRLSILVTVADARTRGDISQFKDFAECFLRAQVEAAHLNRIDKGLAEPKGTAQRQKHLDDMIAALERGLDLANASVP